MTNPEKQSIINLGGSELQLLLEKLERRITYLENWKHNHLIKHEKDERK